MFPGKNSAPPPIRKCRLFTQNATEKSQSQISIWANQLGKRHYRNFTITSKDQTSSSVLHLSKRDHLVGSFALQVNCPLFPSSLIQKRDAMSQLSCHNPPVRWLNATSLFQEHSTDFRTTCQQEFQRNPRKFFHSHNPPFPSPLPQ